jgi:hypothetical protein
MDAVTEPENLDKSTALVPVSALPGANPLRNRRHERFCWLIAQLRPKGEAYRSCRFKATTDHTAEGNASRLLARIDIQDRVAYLSRQEEEILQQKRRRLEEVLWSMHEFNYADLWETVEVDRTDKQGNPILGEDGEPLKKKIQRPKLLSELSEDAQRCIEACSIDERGRVVPKAYSRMAANQELRKLLGIGIVSRDDGDLRRLTDAELIAQLAQQAKELGIEIDLNYRMGNSVA